MDDGARHRTSRRDEEVAVAEKSVTRSTTFRLAPETLADLNYLTRALGVRSRSEALRYVLRLSAHKIQLERALAKHRNELALQRDGQKKAPRRSR